MSERSLKVGAGLLEGNVSVTNRLTDSPPSRASPLLHRRHVQPTIGVHNSTSVPSGQRTYDTTWPQGLVAGGASSVAPWASALAWATNTSSVMNPTSIPSGLLEACAWTWPPSKFNSPNSCAANESVVSPVSSSP